MDPFASTRGRTRPNERAVTPEPEGNPLAGVIESRPDAKNYTVYLECEVVKEIDRLARINRSNRSRVINALLRKAILDK